MKKCKEVAQKILDILKQNSMTMDVNHCHWDGWHIEISNNDNTDSERIKNNKIIVDVNE